MDGGSRLSRVPRSLASKMSLALLSRGSASVVDHRYADMEETRQERKDGGRRWPQRLDYHKTRSDKKDLGLFICHVFRENRFYYLNVKKKSCAVCYGRKAPGLSLQSLEDAPGDLSTAPAGGNTQTFSH